MFCTECGTRAAGKFCGHCGRRLAESGAATADERLAVVVNAFDADGAAPPEDDAQSDFDWRHSVDYRRIVQHVDVRRRLDAADAGKTTRMTGEQVLELGDKLLGGVAGGISFAAIAKIAQPFHAKLGVKTGKSRSIASHLPIGAAIVETLCWLARGGRTLRGVEQLADGCRITAEFPSDIWALAGELHLTVVAAGAGSFVDAETSIPGQKFDWGKSTRCLDELERELHARRAA